MRMRFGSSEEAGFDPVLLRAAFDVVAAAAGTESIPAAALAVGRRGVTVTPEVSGYAVWPEELREPARLNTLFDLASLTKVVGTATACWRLVETGRLRLGAHVAEFVPAFGEVQEGEDPGWRRGVSVRHLLTHTSGLPAGRSLLGIPGGPESRLQAVYATPLQVAPGDRVVYSDLGFMVLAKVVEAVAGCSLPEFCQCEVFGPLGMVDTGWTPPADRGRKAAATEWADRDDQAGYLRGVVHDENARSLGGVAGHAGLFSTVLDLAVFAEMLRSEGRGPGPDGPVRVLSRATVAKMAQPVFLGEGDGRSLGWQTPGRLWGPFGDLWTSSAFGHTGFTGTSLWVDRGHDVWMVLLTNAVHRGRALGGPAIQRVRAHFHNAVIAAIAD